MSESKKKRYMSGSGPDDAGGRVGACAAEKPPPSQHAGRNATQGSAVVSMLNVVESVKVSLSDVKLCLDVVINLLKCFNFPHLEKLYIKVNPCAQVLNKCICMFDCFKKLSVDHH